MYCTVRTTLVENPSRAVQSHRPIRTVESTLSAIHPESPTSSASAAPEESQDHLPCVAANADSAEGEGDTSENLGTGGASADDGSAADERAADEGRAADERAADGKICGADGASVDNVPAERAGGVEDVVEIARAEGAKEGDVEGKTGAESGYGRVADVGVGSGDAENAIVEASVVVGAGGVAGDVGADETVASDPVYTD